MSTDKAASEPLYISRSKEPTSAPNFMKSSRLLVFLSAAGNLLFFLRKFLTKSRQLQDDSDPGNHFAGIERFHKVIVCPCWNTFDASLLSCSCREHDDRNILRAPVATQSLQQTGTI